MINNVTIADRVWNYYWMGRSVKNSSDFIDILLVKAVSKLPVQTSAALWKNFKEQFLSPMILGHKMTQVTKYGLDITC